MKEFFKPTFPFFRPGLLWLRASNLIPIGRFVAGGPRAIYHREITRPLILKSQPVRTAASSSTEVHVLTGKSDWLNLIWALKSFYTHSHGDYALAIHDDGSLQRKQCLALQEHFPDARVIMRDQADREMQAYLRAYPNAEQFRATNYLAQKVFDLEFYLRGNKMLLLDTDVLFFAQPEELEARGHSQGYLLNTLNRNSGFGYAMSTARIRETFGVQLSGDINSGLGILQKGTLNISWIEEWLQCEELRTGHPHRVEQTLIAMCCAEAGFEFLPNSYDVYNGPTSVGLPVRHYYGPVRPLMYSEGLPRLLPLLMTTRKGKHKNI